MTSTRPASSSASRSSVQRDLPPEEEARAARAVVLLVSPREVAMGWVVVGVGGREGWVWRRVVKRSTWARARAEERVEMRRVCWVGRGAVVVGSVVVDMV